MYIKTITVPITLFRKELFKFARLISEGGYEVCLEKDGNKIVKVVKIENTPREKSKKASILAKKLASKLV